jgi:hypothetical protein
LFSFKIKMNLSKEQLEGVPPADKTAVAEYLKKYYGSTLENSYSRKFQKKKQPTGRMNFRKKDPENSQLQHSMTQNDSYDSTGNRGSTHGSREDNGGPPVTMSERLVRPDLPNPVLASERNHPVRTFINRDQPKRPPNAFAKAPPVQEPRSALDLPKETVPHQESQRNNVPTFGPLKREIEGPQAIRPNDSAFGSIQKPSQASQPFSQKSETFRQQVQEFEALLNSQASQKLLKKCEEDSILVIEGINKDLDTSLRRTLTDSLQKVPPVLPLVLPQPFTLPVPDIQLADPRKYDQLMLKSSNAELHNLLRTGRDDKVSFSFGKNTSYQDALSGYNSVADSKFYLSNCSSAFNPFERFLKPISFGGRTGNYESLVDSVRVPSDPIAEVNRRFDRVQGQTDALLRLADNVQSSKGFDTQTGEEWNKVEGGKAPLPTAQGMFLRKKVEEVEGQFSFESKGSQSVHSSGPSNMNSIPGNQQHSPQGTTRVDTGKGDFGRKPDPKASQYEEVKSEGKQPTVAQRVANFESRKDRPTFENTSGPVLTQLVSFSSTPHSEFGSTAGQQIQPSPSNEGLTSDSEPLYLKNNFYLNANNKFSFKDNLLEQALEELRPYNSRSSAREIEEAISEETNPELFTTESPKLLNQALIPRALEPKMSLEAEEFGQGFEDPHEFEVDPFHEPIPASLPMVTRAAISTGPAPPSSQLTHPRPVLTLMQPTLSFEERFDSFIERMLDRRATRIQRAWRKHRQQTRGPTTVSVTSLFNRFLQRKNKEKVNYYAYRHLGGGCQTTPYSLSHISADLGQFIHERREESAGNRKKLDDLRGFLGLLAGRMEVGDA